MSAIFYSHLSPWNLFYTVLRFVCRVICLQTENLHRRSAARKHAESDPVEPPAVVFGRISRSKTDKRSRSETRSLKISSGTKNVSVLILSSGCARPSGAGWKRQLTVSQPDAGQEVLPQNSRFPSFCKR